MSALRETWFISDLHLDPSCPEITQTFFKLLDNLSHSTVDALYILGDLFEVWVGDDDRSSFNESIITQLKSVTQAGTPVYFLPGNRDFLIGTKFLKSTGCQSLSEQTVINLYGEAVLLMHGDTLCTQDHTYLKARKFLRNPITTTCYLALPLRFRKQVAKKIRMKSQRHVSSIPDVIMDVTQSEVENVMLQQKVNFLIHGHTHKPHVHEFRAQSICKKRIVLGAWHEKGNFLRWNNLQAFSLQDFD